MKNWVTKKNILMVGFGGSLSFLVCIFSTNLGLCDQYNGSCVRMLDSASEAFQIFIIVFLFSLVTYKLHNEIFESWVKFAKWWVLGTLILVLIAPAHDPSLLPITKEIVSLFSTGAFTIISLILVATKFFTVRSQK